MREGVRTREGVQGREGVRAREGVNGRECGGRGKALMGRGTLGARKDTREGGPEGEGRRAGEGRCENEEGYTRGRA